MLQALRVLACALLLVTFVNCGVLLAWFVFPAEEAGITVPDVSKESPLAVLPPHIAPTEQGTPRREAVTEIVLATYSAGYDDHAAVPGWIDDMRVLQLLNKDPAVVINIVVMAPPKQLIPEAISKRASVEEASSLADARQALLGRSHVSSVFMTAPTWRCPNEQDGLNAYQLKRLLESATFALGAAPRADIPDMPDEAMLILSPPRIAKDGTTLDDLLGRWWAQGRPMPGSVGELGSEELIRLPRSYAGPVDEDEVAEAAQVPTARLFHILMLARVPEDDATGSTLLDTVPRLVEHYSQSRFLRRFYVYCIGDHRWGLVDCPALQDKLRSVQTVTRVISKSAKNDALYGRSTGFVPVPPRKDAGIHADHAVLILDTPLMFFSLLDLHAALQTWAHFRSRVVGLFPRHQGRPSEFQSGVISVDLTFAMLGVDLLRQYNSSPADWAHGPECTSTALTVLSQEAPVAMLSDTRRRAARSASDTGAYRLSAPIPPDCIGGLEYSLRFKMPDLEWKTEKLLFARPTLKLEHFVKRELDENGIVWEFGPGDVDSRTRERLGPLSEMKR